MMNGVYGQTYQTYGPGPTVVRTSGVALPLASQARPRSDCYPGCMNWTAFGIILSLLASASLALGVADVVLTYQKYANGSGCSTTTCNPNVLVWTWVAVGIWASIPVFIFGFVSVRNATRPQRHACMEFFAFICTFLFTPAMCALSAIEVWKGAGVYYWPYLAPLTSNDLVKAAIPLAIAGLGLVELLMCFIALCYTCCCDYAHPSRLATYGVAAPAAPVVLRTGTYDRPVYQPALGPRAQIFPPAFNRGAPQLSGASYYSSGGGGFAAPPPPARPVTYNYFSNARQPAIASSPYAGGVYGGGAGPNPSYTFYQR